MCIRDSIYTPHVYCGDYVIVINAEKVEVTGKKRKEKIYKRHTGYPEMCIRDRFDSMNIRFTIEEENIIAIYAEDSRETTLENILAAMLL